MAEINKNYERMPRFGRAGAGGAQRFSPHEKPKNAAGTAGRLLKYLLRRKRALLLAALFTVMSAAITVTVPLLLGKAVNTFDIAAGTVDRQLLGVILVSLVLCYLASWALDTSNGVITAKVTQRIVREIRYQFFSKLQKLPLTFYDTRANGDTMSRMTNDVDNISATISQAAVQLLSSLFIIGGTFVMMLRLNLYLTAAALSAVLLSSALTRTIARRSRGYFLGQQRTLGALGGIIEEAVTGLRTVKAFNRQEAAVSDFRKANGELRGYATRAQTWAGFMMPFMNVINNLSFALIACLGGVLSVRGEVTVGMVVSFLTYSKQFGQPLSSIAGMWGNIQSALAGAERVFEILDEAEELPDEPGAVSLGGATGAVEFRNVTFSYVPGRPVLKNVSFSVSPGEVVALVGETGAGKTTIVNLLTRFYDPDSGGIFIDGHNIKDVSRSSLRDCFSVVLQDTCLFTGTIGRNIKYSRPDSSDAEVREAARLARADGFISRLPKGYDTPVAGSSDSLSLGQRQLIAIARAILCGAPILILDEATSSVDTRTEKEIQRALITLMKGRTCFLIAHRLSTIRDADRIMVIGGGEIRESGTHRELMEKKGPYYEMVKSQLGPAPGGRP